METKNVLSFTLERETSNLNPKAYLVLMKAYKHGKAFTLASLYGQTTRQPK